MAIEIEITKDYKHWTKGFIMTPPAMLREYLLKIGVAKIKEEKIDTKRSGRPRKSNTDENRS